MKINNIKKKVKDDLEKWLDTYNGNPRTDEGVSVKEYSKGRVDAYCELNIFLERLLSEY